MDDNRPNERLPQGGLPDDNPPDGDPCVDGPEGGEQRGADQSISLEELSQSFAQLLGERKPVPPAPDADDVLDDADEAVYSLDDDCPPNPQSIVEAMLFVGHPSNEPLTNRQIASLIRGVSPDEIDAFVRDLNTSYETHSAPYRIVLERSGYRMALIDDYDPIRERFYGRIRRARLSQSAIDVLALVAYHQPMTQKEIEKIRQRPSAGALSHLVKRGLLKTDEIKVKGKKKRRKVYETTDRFLKLFQLESLDDLPQSHDMDPAT